MSFGRLATAVVVALQCCSFRGEVRVWMEEILQSGRASPKGPFLRFCSGCFRLGNFIFVSGLVSA